MSSSPTDRTSTTGSSTSSPSRPDGDTRGTRVALVACGAIAQPAAAVIAGHDWPVDVHPLPPLLHNRPHLIADEVRRLATALSGDYADVAVGYADCGTYGALDAVCEELGLRRLPGLHCYDLYDGEETLAARLEAEPGTYLLTDFLARTFEHTVMRELGLDRHPELRDAYFAHYTRMLWLAQHPTPATRAAAERAAEHLGLPLEVREVGDEPLERQLEALFSG
jgi:hypothetical protein